MRRCETRILKAGQCRHPESTTRRGASHAPAVFPALVGLIVHPVEGPILFDTGYDPAFLAATEAFPGRLYRWATPVTLGEGEPVSRQLARFGFAPEDVRWIVLSHFHGDHAAGLHAFPNAAIVCARAGLAHARRGGEFTAVRHGVLRALLPPDLDARARFFEDLPRVPLPTAFAPFTEGGDVLGDASLIAVDLPGHCPGHWGLALRDAEDRWRFFVGDAAWSSLAIRENLPPPPLTLMLLGHGGTYRETLSALHALNTANPALDLIPSHCREQAARAEPL